MSQSVTQTFTVNKPLLPILSWLQNFYDFSNDWFLGYFVKCCESSELCYSLKLFATVQIKSEKMDTSSVKYLPKIKEIKLPTKKCDIWKQETKWTRF